MKRRWSQVLNLIIVGGLLFFAYKRLPGIVRHLKAEGTHAPTIMVPTITGNVFDSIQSKGPLVVIFWATWCPPCEIELSRINKMILKKEIESESVLAISIENDLGVVEKAVKERNYQFQVGIDSNGQIAKSFGVVATPTVVLIDENQSINWIATGLSPSLEFRVNRLLKQ